MHYNGNKSLFCSVYVIQIQMEERKVLGIVCGMERRFGGGELCWYPWMNEWVVAENLLAEEKGQLLGGEKGICSTWNMFAEKHYGI